MIEVYVWHAFLATVPAQPGAYRALLTADELARAERFYFECDRRYFIAARGLLRTLLAQYTGIPPAQLRFEYGPHGKPALAAEQARHADVRFNISHSHGRAVFAFCPGRTVGVDVERIRTDVEWETLARQFFSAREVELLHACPACDQRHAFFRCWTRKEAYLKALGGGLSAPLDGFSVSVEAERAALLEVADHPTRTTQWQLASLDAGADYAAALAVECPCTEELRIVEKQCAPCEFS